MTSLYTDQTLLFDADDTLWECNKYFEHAIHEFIAFLHHEHLSDAEVRLVLDEFERANGYGAEAFARSLVETFRELATENDPGDEDTVRQMGLRILGQEMEPIDGVEETLHGLQPHHRLLLFTKGDEEEQELKIRRSPLASFFDLHIIVHDKTPDTYRDVIDSLALDPATTWMIGNSLRSDIAPALTVGLHAIYIPNPHTWHMEHANVIRDESWPGTWLELEQFSDLRSVFVTSQAG